MMEKKRSVSLLPALICLAGMAALLLLWRNAYQNAVFSRLSAFCGIFLEQNPQLEGEVLSALQEYQRGMEIYGGSEGEDGRRDFLVRYGYEAADFAPALPAFGAPGTGERGAGGLTACSIGLALAASAAVFFLLQRYGRKEKNRIDGLTDYLEQVRQQYPDRFFVCGMCEFRKPGFFDQAVSLAERGFRAIKIPAQRLLLPEGRVWLTGEEMMKMFHLMEERGMILSIDLADGDTQTGEMEEIISECPDLKIAIGHFGMVTRPGWLAQVRLARHPHVRLESGGITWLFNDEFYPFKGAVRAIREAADEVGFEKLMWGSDYPRTITAITYRMSYDFVLKSDELTDDEKRLFLGENARRFYQFGALPELPYIKNMSE